MKLLAVCKPPSVPLSFFHCCVYALGVQHCSPVHAQAERGSRDLVVSWLMVCYFLNYRDAERLTGEMCFPLLICSILYNTRRLGPMPNCLVKPGHTTRTSSGSSWQGTKLKLVGHVPRRPCCGNATDYRSCTYMIT